MENLNNDKNKAENQSSQEQSDAVSQMRVGYLSYIQATTGLAIVGIIAICIVTCMLNNYMALFGLIRVAGVISCIKQQECYEDD